MQIGFDRFVATAPDPVTGKLMRPADLINNLIDEIDLADKLGLDVVGLGEHHRAEFLDSASAVIVAAAASNSRIRLANKLIQSIREGCDHCICFVDKPRGTAPMPKGQVLSDRSL